MPDLNDVYGDFKMDEKMDQMQSTCCSQSMRVWVIICNIILLILAIASFGIGIYVQTQPGFAWTASSIGVGLILVGVCMLALAGLGIFSACKESKCLFGIYGTLLLIFFIAQLAALIVAIAATSVLVTGAAETWKTLDKDHKHGVGMFFGCCSVPQSEEKYSKQGDKTFTTCENPDNLALYPESTKGDANTYTSWTGECTVFGVDYKAEGDDEVKYVSFPEYNNAYLNGGTVCAPKTASKADFDACNALSVATTVNGVTVTSACSRNDKCKEADPKECARPAKITEQTDVYAIPSQCLCPVNADTKLGEANCRTKLGAIPSCENEALTTFPFFAGINDDYVNIDIARGASACYAKLEVFLSENTAAMGIIAFIFVYQLVLLIFTFALCCFVDGKKSDGTSDV